MTSFVEKRHGKICDCQRLSTTNAKRETDEGPSGSPQVSLADSGPDWGEGRWIESTKQVPFPGSYEYVIKISLKIATHQQGEKTLYLSGETSHSPLN